MRAACRLLSPYLPKRRRWLHAPIIPIPPSPPRWRTACRCCSASASATACSATRNWPSAPACRRRPSARLTYTLAARGLLRYDAQLRRYRLGSTTLALGYPLLATLRIRQLARPLMKQLADEIDGSVSLGLRDRTQMVYVETSRGHDAMAFRPDIGATLPMLPTAIGRAWLCTALPRESAPVLAALRKADQAEFRGQASALGRAREEMAEFGFCTSRGEWQSDIHAVAAPLPTRIDGEVMVFNCGVLGVRMTPSKLERQMGPRLLRMVAKVEAALRRSR
jgi:Transcriptional regulator